MNNSIATVFFIHFMTLLTVVMVHICCDHKASAQDQTALHLAQCIMAEVDGRCGETEWAAHAWVLQKRADMKGVSLDEMVLQYCAVFDRRAAAYYGPRAEKIRRSSFQAPLHGKVTVWRRLERFATAFIARKTKDPCPAARHFGNEADIKGKPRYREVCKWLGRCGNKVYKINK